MAVNASICVFLLVTALTFVSSEFYQGKIRGPLLASLKSKERVNILISLKDGDTVPVLRNLETSLHFQNALEHGQKASLIASALRAHARKIQRPLIQLLQTRFPSMEFNAFWITNSVYLRNVHKEVIEILAEADFVHEIAEEEIIHITDFHVGSTPAASLNERNHTFEFGWGLAQMRVPQVWEMDEETMGHGLVVGSIDTGVRGTHNLLRSKWAGLDKHGWFDPREKSQLPHDIYDHGTFTIGMIVSDLGIGPVPNATWLSCKGYQNNGTGFESDFIACCEYMLCPTDTQGNNPDCSLAPHVVSNSWGLNGGNPNFSPAIYAWNTAGIVSSFSAGNEALYGCGSIRSPADQPHILSVGATDKEQRRHWYSSLGPSYNGLIKPDISAPAGGIWSPSAASDDAMMYGDGTSASCPSTSGVLALLKNRDRTLLQAKAMEILIKTANQEIPNSGNSCGGISEEDYPNNHVGNGRVDAYSAMLELTKSQKMQS